MWFLPTEYCARYHSTGAITPCLLPGVLKMGIIFLYFDFIFYWEHAGYRKPTTQCWRERMSLQTQGFFHEYGPVYFPICVALNGWTSLPLLLQGGWGGRRVCSCHSCQCKLKRVPRSHVSPRQLYWTRKTTANIHTARTRAPNILAALGSIPDAMLDTSASLGHKTPSWAILSHQGISGIWTKEQRVSCQGKVLMFQRQAP